MDAVSYTPPRRDYPAMGTWNKRPCASDQMMIRAVYEGNAIELLVTEIHRQSYTLHALKSKVKNHTNRRQHQLCFVCKSVCVLYLWYMLDNDSEWLVSYSLATLIQWGELPVS